MKKYLLVFLFFVIFSCMKSEIKQNWYEKEGAAIDNNGLQYYFLDGSRVSYCSGGWGRKFCRFLEKHDGTIWADAENYYSDFSDIKFLNPVADQYFISFFNIDNIASNCEGWKLGETITNNGIKWNIRIKKDEVDVLWFDYDYYGFSEEIEYRITYKYEVIDGLLNFSSNEDETFIFNPSEKNYSKDFVDTGEIIISEGCLFY